MRKIIVCALTVLLITGCEAAPQKINSESLSADQIELSQETDLGLPNLLNTFNRVVEEGTPNEAKLFLDEYMKTASVLDSDIMLTMYVEQQRNFLEGYSDLIFDWTYQKALLDAYDKSYNLDKLSNQYSEDVMVFLKGIKRDGFLLNYHEGIVTLYPDYNLLKNYNQFVSDSISDYIEILSRESSEILSADGGLTITWEELAFRVLNTERYLTKHSDSIRYNEIFEMYKWYLNTLLTGLPDTPIYYRNSNLIRNDVLQSYNKTVIHNTDTKTSSILKEYLDIIRSKDNKIDGEALDYVRETLKTLTFSTY